jgi:hypothetical protein
VALVEVENLCRSFGLVNALEGLNFSVEQGEIFGLMGPDGAGKTTCLRILCGLMRPTSGKAVVLGKDVAKNHEAVKDQIGYMAQPAKLTSGLARKGQALPTGGFAHAKLDLVPPQPSLAGPEQHRCGTSVPREALLPELRRPAPSRAGARAGSGRSRWR